MVEATSNLPHIAAAVTLARYFAKREVKSEWRKQNSRWWDNDAHDLAKAAKAYLNQHPELIDQARACLLQWSYSHQKTNTGQAPGSTTQGQSNHD